MTATPRFLQMHFLTSYPATLLNRDGSGLAKRLPFGEESRTRISSQCLKRHWRMSADHWSLRSLPKLGEVDFGVRSRSIFQSAISEHLIESEELKRDVEELKRDVVEEIVPLLQEALKFKASKKRKNGQEEDEDDDDENASTDANGPDTDQAFMLGLAEIEYLRKIVRDIAKNEHIRQQVLEKPKDKKKLTAWQKTTRKLLTGATKDLRNNLAAMGVNSVLPRGLESALFGRMVTSDLIANTDAAIHVAHAFTVHAEAAECDYFTVVDDIKSAEGESGAGGLFDTELTAGLFYGYVVIDVPLLVSNLAGDAVLSGKVVEHLTHLIATVSPGAKKGSTAPYAYADLVLIEAGQGQPRTLANAYRTPCRARVDEAVRRMSEYLTKIDAAYGNAPQRAHLSIEEAALPGSSAKSLDNLGAWARDLVASQIAA